MVLVDDFFVGDCVAAGFESGATAGAVSCSGVGCSTGGAGSVTAAGAGFEILVSFTGVGALRRVET